MEYIKARVYGTSNTMGKVHKFKIVNELPVPGESVRMGDVYTWDKPTLIQLDPEQRTGDDDKLFDYSFWEIYDVDEEGMLSEPHYFAKRQKAEISLDNGVSFIDAGEAIIEIEKRGIWDIVIEKMDDDVREGVHLEVSPCSNLEFLERYLEVAPWNLIVG